MGKTKISCSAIKEDGKPLSSVKSEVFETKVEAKVKPPIKIKRQLPVYNAARKRRMFLRSDKKTEAPKVEIQSVAKPLNLPINGIKIEPTYEIPPKQPSEKNLNDFEISLTVLFLNALATSLNIEHNIFTLRSAKLALTNQEEGAKMLALIKIILAHAIHFLQNVSFEEAFKQICIDNVTISQVLQMFINSMLAKAAQL